MKRTEITKSARKDDTSTEFHLMLDSYPNNFQPNWLTDARHEFSELEANIFLFTINQLSNLAIEGKIEKGFHQRFYIPFSIIDSTLKNYSYIHKASKSLMNKKIEFYDEQTKDFDVITPFPRLRSLTISNKKYLEVSMLSDVVPAFIELGKHYTKYDLKIALSLKSMYAKRFYQIVMQYANLKIPVTNFRISVQDLRFALNAPAHYTFSDFNKYCLKIALREIAVISNIDIKVTYSKKVGKAIQELEFSYLTEKMYIKKEVDTAVRQVNEIPLAKRLSIARQVMDQLYTFQSWQIDAILSTESLLDKFINLDFQITKGQLKIQKSKTAYVVASLGLQVNPKEKKKAKSGR